MNKVVIVVIVVVVVVVVALMVMKSGKGSYAHVGPAQTTGATTATGGPAPAASPSAGAPSGTKYPESALQEYMEMDPSQWKTLPQGLQDQLAEYAKTHPKTGTAAPAAK